MARDLQLTPDQQKQVEQAFERGAERLEKFRTATREQFDVLKKQLDDDIDRVLTPEQRVKNQKMREDERRRRPPPGGRAARRPWPRRSLARAAHLPARHHQAHRHANSQVTRV